MATKNARNRPGRVQVSPLADILAAGPAGALSSAMLNPLDMAKTRIQLGMRPGGMPTPGAQPTAGAVPRGPIPRTMLGCVRGIVKYEGVSSLFRGLAPFSVLLTGSMVVKMGCYRPMQNVLESAIGATRGQQGYEVVLSPAGNVLRDITASGITGFAAGFLTSPATMLKTRMMTGKATTGTMWGEIKLLASSASGAHSQEGAASRVPRWLRVLQPFYMGGNIAATRMAIGNVAHLASYDLAKRNLIAVILRTKEAVGAGEKVLPGLGYLASWEPDGPLVHLACSMVAAVVVVTVACPADTVMSLLHSQQRDAAGRGVEYSGTIDCFRKAVRREGFGMMFRAWGSMYWRLAPAAVCITMLWERFRILASDAGL